jgi:hypothetical protein
VQRAGAASTRGNDFFYRNMFHAVYNIAANEGIKALFNGAFARILYHVPNVAICMSVIEYVKPDVASFLASF